MTASHFSLTVWEPNCRDIRGGAPTGFTDEQRARDAYHRARNQGLPCRLEQVTVLEESEGA